MGSTNEEFHRRFGRPFVVENGVGVGDVGLEPVFDPPDVFARFLRKDRART